MTPIQPKYSDINGRIINGFPAQINQFPWHASVTATTAAGVSSICGGSLISQTWVLTAAHCTFGKQTFTVGLGSNILGAPAVQLSTVRAIEHPQFNSSTYNNDIALLQLPSAVAITPSTQVVQLARISHQTTTFAGEQARISGFGLQAEGGSISQTLYWVNLQVITNANCANVFGSAIVSSTLCATGWDFPAQGTCNGDSGGPLVWSEAGSWTQIGLVSFISARGCAYGDPSGYTRLSHYVNWIEVITGITARP